VRCVDEAPNKSSLVSVEVNSMFTLSTESGALRLAIGGCAKKEKMTIHCITTVDACQCFLNIFYLNHCKKQKNVLKLKLYYI
jgi:cob(I)alamin adenosyltransferase